MNKQNDVLQVSDDLDLLELMMKDKESIPDLYNPPDYWRKYEKDFLPELRRLGLRDFRRRKNSILSSFGATDLLPWSRGTNAPILKIVQSLLNVKSVDRFSKLVSKFISGFDFRDLRLLCYEYAKLYGQVDGAKPITELDASLLGNPEDVFSVDGKIYTPSLLNYYCQYAYCCRHVDFSSINTIMEIGSGSGKQIEVIKKLHPDICYYVFEIPPQLYVCERYLSALFPDSVISYRQTRTMTRVPEHCPGKIFLFGNWKIAELANLRYDLCWNSATFQELEPDVVLNYLKHVNQQANTYVFLYELMKGNEYWVRNRTTIEHYQKGLEDFELQDLSRATLPLYASRDPYYFSFWGKKPKQ